MLAVIIEDEYSRLVRLEEGQQKVSLAGTEVTLMINSGTITVNEGSGISVSLLSKGSGIWRLCRNDQACHLILIREDMGLGQILQLQHERCHNHRERQGRRYFPR